MLMYLILKLERAPCASTFIFIFLTFLGKKELVTMFSLPPIEILPSFKGVSLRSAVSHRRIREGLIDKVTYEQIYERSEGVSYRYLRKDCLDRIESIEALR